MTLAVREQATLALTDEEGNLLALCEAEVAVWHRATPKAAQALATIFERRLWRRDYQTWEAYCGGRWGFTSSRVRQLVEWGQVSTIVQAAGLPAPENEAQARVLAGLPEAQRVEGWREAVTSAPGGKVTAKHVATVTEPLRPRAARQPRLPETEVPTNGNAAPEPRPQAPDPFADLLAETGLTADEAAGIVRRVLTVGRRAESEIPKLGGAGGVEWVLRVIERESFVRRMA